MTLIRRPNRRRVPELAELVNGGSCPTSRKVRYLDERTAAIALRHIAAADPDAERAGRLQVYQHEACGDWHVGHRPERRDG